MVDELFKNIKSLLIPANKQEEPNGFCLRIEINVHPKDSDKTGLSRSKEIKEQINKVAKMNFCDYIIDDTLIQKKSKPESVTFIASKDMKNVKLFMEKLKKQIGIEIEYKKVQNLLDGRIEGLKD